MRLIELIPLTQSYLTEDCQAADCDNRAAVALVLNPYGKRSHCNYCGTEIMLCADHLASALDGLAADLDKLPRN